MIKITQIDEKFSVYRNNKVVLWGAGRYGKKLLDFFNYFNLSVYAFCDNDEQKWGNIISGIKVVSPAELEQCKDPIIIQIALAQDKNKEIISQMKEINKKYISFDEAMWVFQVRRNIDMYELNSKRAHQSDMFFQTQYNTQALRLSQAIMLNPTSLVIGCQPPKTADITLINTFYNKNISYYNVEHQTNAINLKMLKFLYSKVKIITAVREPISQNFSCFFQYITQFYRSEILNNFLRCSEKGTLDSLDVTNLIFKNGGNCQMLFDLFLTELYGENEELDGLGREERHIQLFVPQFQKHIIDILAHPFDKEKGYAIMRENNVEVFVYQLEKLNNIIPELSDWVGVPFDKLESANVGADKWTGESYKQAQRELTFSQEYFDACYNEPYVKHFYSDEDIEKFKARWRPHIR